ncbi:MAG: LacI family DNA-binding transcriptional regulator [Chloroflexi bacterium]|nr:LacI family DNA-binding transcriptional regulator [Chloroflexota bacterium]
MEDIARLAGVSRSTVSRVINHHPNVSPATREKVWQVIQEQKFHPNQIARMLATQRTQILGIVVSQTAAVFFDDPSAYFPTLIQGIAEVANQQNYSTLLWLGGSGEGENHESFHRQISHNHLADGLVLLSASASHPLIARLVDTPALFVTIERPRHFAERVSYVTIDNVQAARTAVEHLIQLGRRKIAIITGPLLNTDSHDRVIGYQQAMEAAGLAVDPRWIVYGEFNTDTGQRAMKSLLPLGLDAVFAASDQIALGVLQTLREAGVCVPQDMAVVGFDDLPAATATTPQLTTIHHPIREKGAYATRLLLGLIEGSVPEPQQVLLPTHLVIRQSCGALNAQDMANLHG